jgi:hypothetical protein
MSAGGYCETAHGAVGEEEETNYMIYPSAEINYPLL